MERIFFESGEQRKFLQRVIDNSRCFNLKGLLQFGLNVKYSTLIKYFNECYFMPSDLVKDFCVISKMNFDSLSLKILPKNWGQIKGGKIGIVKMKQKYKDKLSIWCAKGKKNNNFSTKKIKYPLLDENLAELIGIYLGDGTITKYLFRISGDKRYDTRYFDYIKKLIFDLFGIEAKIAFDKRSTNLLYLVVYSKEFCSFFEKNYSLKAGNKIRNKSRIPSIVLSNPNLALACLRGLIDTDGSISRRGRNGSQFCINFTSHNSSLLKQVEEFGKRMGFFSYSNKNNVGTNSWQRILDYFNTVGSSNLRHIVRFYLRFQNKTIYVKEVTDYYEKPFYRNIDLPFKLKKTS